ncbi:hypothetical protein ACF1AE_27955 [Streptomyces sp. NPDC014986]|uniref:hypothetical protein n=1 Tax=Streptomyces sp. NPDC014986 TaxID=3364934 RepID=UPI0037031387
MGVFARLFRRSRTTEETRTAEARADGTAGGSGTGDAAGPTEPKGSDETPRTAETAVREADEVTGGESVDIPKQQQSSGAADSEAGEGART